MPVMLQLHQFAPAMGLPNASPFCLKVEAFLRLAGIPYQTVPVGNPSKGPRGKAPWIVDDGETVADSRFILDYLNLKHGSPLQGELSPAHRAALHALTRMLEEHLYFLVLQERWLEPENAPVTREAFFGAIPGPLRKPVFALVQRGTRARVMGQGVGRLSRIERIVLGKRDIDAAAALLGDLPYFGGDRPVEADASAFAFIANLVRAPITSELTDYARGHQNLTAYSERMMQQLFPEFGG